MTTFDTAAVDRLRRLDGWPRARLAANILISHLVGAELYHDPTPRHIEDEGRLATLAKRLRSQGRRPYLIPGGASDHRLGGFGYAACAAEIVAQASDLGVRFDAV